ncbi:MAG: WG repeat-containing protein [Candidatus Azobacteroides sp.]|nr:WG repeat-containing protein [Candidatus Azobacteroides sp.]
MEGQIQIASKDYCPIEIRQNNNKYQILTCSGKVILNDIDSIGRLFNWYWLVKSNNKYGIYDASGEKILDIIYDEITFPGSIWVLNAEFTVRKGNKYGIYNGKGAATVPIAYDEIKFKQGVFVLLKENKEYFLINNIVVKDKILLDKTFRVLGDFPSDNTTFYVFQKDNKQGILDENGAVFLDPRYDDIVPKRVMIDGSAKNFLFVKTNNKWGMIDMNDSMIVPIQYESIELVNPDYLTVEMDGLKQFYDLKNRRLITDYNFERHVGLDKFSRIEKNGMQTLIDNQTMQLVFPFKYEDISYNEKSNNFTVKLNNKYGIIDFDEKIIVPIIYDNFWEIPNGNNTNSQ